MIYCGREVDGAKKINDEGRWRCARCGVRDEDTGVLMALLSRPRGGLNELAPPRVGGSPALGQPFRP
eukprot:714930-Heterocapsa_arctica.AAC.1